MRINMESDMYKNVRTILSGVVGFGASILTGNYCNHLISSCTTETITGQKTLMKVGKVGLEGVVLCNVTAEAADTIDSLADAANSIFELIDIYKSTKEEGTVRESKMITYEEN